MQPNTKNIFLELPMPPSINSYWRFTGNRRFLTDKAKQFKSEVAHIVTFQPIRFEDAKLEITVTINFRDKRVQDLDNRCKPLFDALVQAGLMNDDSQIKVFHVYEGPIVKGGKCSVKINVLPF
jgi:crossover junction endodeoxyribonuclease RusA